MFLGSEYLRPLLQISDSASQYHGPGTDTIDCEMLSGAALSGSVLRWHYAALAVYQYAENPWKCWTIKLSAL